MSREQKLITRDAKGRPLRWRDSEGVLHAVEQNPKAGPSNVASWWTRCGAWHISFDAAWGGCDEPTCATCRTIERGI